jgi:ABC-type Fe3+-citrate transport system substrate-binding protein
MSKNIISLLIGGLLLAACSKSENNSANHLSTSARDTINISVGG